MTINRRTILKTISSSIAAVCAAVVAVPGVRYVFATVARSRTEGRIVQRVARLAELPVGRPVAAVVSGSRRDAWTSHPDETIGRIWLVRRPIDDTASPAQVQVDAFSAVCPHLRCTVQCDAARRQFVCPCHKGVFDWTGRPLSAQELGRTNPVPRALEAVHCHVVQDDHTGEWWVEVAYDVA
jgi:Rieske Fe-S protein